MKRIDELTEEEKKRMVKWGMIFVILVGVIGILYSLIFIGFLRNLLGLTQPITSLFAPIRTIFVTFYVTGFFPSSLLWEFTHSHVFKRSFRKRNVLIYWLLSGEAVLIGVVLLTLFDILFSEMSILIQAPLASISLSVPALILAAIFRMERTSRYIKKAYGSA